MEFGSALRVLLRQWIVVLVGVMLTLGAAAYLYNSTAPTYRATARLLLLLPSDARGAEEVGSPFLYLPNGLNVLARVVAAAPATQAFRSALLSQDLTSPYEVGVDPSTPVITVGVEGPNPDNVIATRDGLVQAVEQELLTVQTEEGVPPQQTARLRVFAAEETPTRLSGDRTRSVLAVVAAGGLLTLIAAFGIDALTAARRSRRHTSHGRRSGPVPPESDGEPSSLQPTSAEPSPPDHDAEEQSETTSVRTPS
jgi:hypothetical protein